MHVNDSIQGLSFLQCLPPKKLILIGKSATKWIEIQVQKVKENVSCKCQTYQFALFFLTWANMNENSQGGGSNGVMVESNHHEPQLPGTHVRWTRGVHFLSIFVLVQHFSKVMDKLRGCYLLPIQSLFCMAWHEKQRLFKTEQVIEIVLNLNEGKLWDLYAFFQIQTSPSDH